MVLKFRRKKIAPIIASLLATAHFVLVGILPIQTSQHSHEHHHAPNHAKQHSTLICNLRCTASVFVSTPDQAPPNAFHLSYEVLRLFTEQVSDAPSLPPHPGGLLISFLPQEYSH